MTCIRCELTRAKIVATTMNAFGYSWIDIMYKLNSMYPGNLYYFEREPIGEYLDTPRCEFLKRTNQTPPHVPYVILER